MDSQVLVDGLLVEVVDVEWSIDKLPDEDIAIPVLELPDPEPDASTPNLTLRQQENRWPDLMLANLSETNSLNTSS